MYTDDPQTLDQLRAENHRLQQRVAELEREVAVGRTLTHHFPLGIIKIFDHALRFVEVHWTAIERGGLSREAVVGHTIYEVLPPELCAILEPYYRAALEGSSGNVQMAFADGTYDLYTLPVRDDHDQVIAGMTLAYDITDRLAAEAKLRESEEKFRVLSAAAQDAIIMMDNEGLICFWNAAAERVLGYTSQEALGQELHRLIVPPAYYESYRQGMQTFCTTGKGPAVGHTATLEAIHKDGHLCPLELSLSSVQVRGAWYGIGILRDITERKQAEAELRRLNTTLQRQSAELHESQILLRGFLDHSPAVMLAKDLQGQVILHNRRFQAFWQTEQPLMGTTCHGFFPQEQAQNLDMQDLQVVQTGQAIERELTLPRNDELLTYMRVVFPIADESGCVYAVGSIASDITERKRVEEALKQANDDLTRWATALEQRNQEIVLLSEMSDLLQTCRSDDEASAVITQIMPHMFLDVSGALYTITASRTHAEAVALWGAQSAQPVCTPEECWALRRGRTHLSQNTAHGLICDHLTMPLPTSTLCVPMMAQGETLGMLHLSCEQGTFCDGMQQLAVTVAEHIALALANMRLRETLRHQAIRDPLTGLYNRRYMEESLERELRRAARHATSLGVVMLDLDNFKRFNDTFGHAAGDMLLREMGGVLQSVLRGEDIACRYGGEEFILIILDADLDTVVQRAEQIRQAGRQLVVVYRGQSLGAVTLSVGMALFPDHGITGDALVRVADQALYHAKTTGRDRLVVGCRNPKDG